ncbi:MAG: METTL5 family protein [Candidatus Woesearchaeota archaeon]
MVSKRDLSVTLSRLKGFEDPSLKDEQYVTDSEIAGDILWTAFMSGEIEGKTIADLGAGTGVLGIGSLLLGAKKVYFVEKDKKAADILKKNLTEISSMSEFKGKYEIVEEDVKKFSKKTDLTIQNPPFGTKTKHADKAFLEKAFETSNMIYSFHKTSTEDFVKAITKDHGFKIQRIYDYNYPLKNTHIIHKKKIERIKVSCYKLIRQ